MEIDKKEVLVKLGERSRSVTFKSSSDLLKERELLLIAIRSTFKDVLKEDEERIIVLYSQE